MKINNMSIKLSDVTKKEAQKLEVLFRSTKALPVQLEDNLLGFGAIDHLTIDNIYSEGRRARVEITGVVMIEASPTCCMCGTDASAVITWYQDPHLVCPNCYRKWQPEKTEKYFEEELDIPKDVI